jgi:RNA polymerase-binding protein DksA
MGHVAKVAETAKESAKAVLVTGRTLTPPVELEPRRSNEGALRALRIERQRLIDELTRQDVVEQEHPTTGNHMADDATEVSEQAKTLALRRHLEGMIKEMDRAIVRAERGKYGICERCGKAIAEERLKVVPSTSLCIDCAKSQVRSIRVTA